MLSLISLEPSGTSELYLGFTILTQCVHKPWQRSSTYRCSTHSCVRSITSKILGRFGGGGSSTNSSSSPFPPFSSSARLRLLSCSVVLTEAASGSTDWTIDSAWFLKSSPAICTLFEVLLSLSSCPSSSLPRFPIVAAVSNRGGVGRRAR
jgi:hypothetical protein